MADDTLATLGQKVTDVFVNAFASGNPNISLVFLPFALPTPDDIVQDGVVNPTRLASFLLPNFDAPYLMSPTQYSVNGKDLYYGSASQIYSLAVTAAQPTAAAGSDAWKRLDAEIAMAKSVLSPPGVSPELACVPDDWPLDNTSYWSVFDSTQVQSAPTTPAGGTSTGGRPPIAPLALNPSLWTIKPAQAQQAPLPSLAYLHEVSPAMATPLLTRTSALTTTPEATINPILMKATVAESVSPSPRLLMSPALAAEAVEASGQGPVARDWVIRHPFPFPVSPPPPPPPPSPPPTSSMSVTFDYMSATIGFTSAGISIWDGVFLADPNWCVPGMPRGGLLPAPNVAVPEGQAPLVYGLPTAIVVVKNLNISVQWSGQDQEALSGNGFIGPFSLAGGLPPTDSNGTWTYSRPGMQIIALLCSHLPVLPPADAPDVVQALPPAPATSTPPTSSSNGTASSPDGGAGDTDGSGSTGNDSGTGDSAAS